jgi:hypothetical protein
VRRIALVVMLVVAAACSSDAGSKEAFCEQLPKTADLLSLMSQVETSDPAALRQAFDEGLADFRALERAAPRELRSDVGAVADAAERLADAIERNAGDPAALAEELQRNKDEYIGVQRPALEVARYAQEECGIDLGGGPAPSSSPPTTLPPTTPPG